MNHDDLKSVGIIGESRVMRALAQHIATAARCDLTVLVTGESGAGKELVAQAIHRQSERSARPFISVNCGALTETLLESELFGYERGAFTGANQKQKGLFEAAHTGTILLDEIGEMSTACQVKLLRVLQEGAIRPVGGHSETKIDVRVIAATNRDLNKEIAVGRFRQDLYYRIAVFTIRTPPLRKRPSDIPLLIQHFLRQAERAMKSPLAHRLSDDAMGVLTDYPWPGNVRQLRHVVEKLVATAIDQEVITTKMVFRAIPVAGASVVASQIPLTFHETDTLDNILDRTLVDIYEYLVAKTGGHSQAARLLRMNRTALYQRVERARQRIQGLA